MDQRQQSDIEDRCQITKLLLDFEHKESMDLAQKAKVKWAIEGDENSKYFHGIINKKRRNNAIREILIDGEWVDDPTQVKQEFFNHFASRFDAPDWDRPITDSEFPSTLTNDQSATLEEEITQEEVKKAVWDCGSKKSPRPNGFTFDFFKKFWYLIGEDLSASIVHFFSSGKFPRGCN